MMGGIADYSGSVVLQWPLACTAVVVLQRRSDSLLRAHSLQAAAEGFHPLIEADLKRLAACRDYADARALLCEPAEAAWAAYLLGAFFVLRREGRVASWPGGANVLLHSQVPIGAGVASSAAIEVAGMKAIDSAYDIGLDGLELARLCQMVENRVVGAPCGIMDQVTASLGRAERLLLLRCRPHDVLGFHALPPGCQVIGINSRVKHAVGGSRYTRTRVAAFMGLAIIRRHLGGDDAVGYLSDITPAQFRRDLYSVLPPRLRGRDFLERYGATPDPVTEVVPDETYSVRACTAHPIYENHRVKQFLRYLQEAKGPSADTALAAAGRLMYASHWSYGKLCALGSRETDVIVRAVRRRGHSRGLYGAKITGGGSGGTVAVLAAEGVEDALAEVLSEYERETGIALGEGDVMTRSSDGAEAAGAVPVQIAGRA